MMVLSWLCWIWQFPQHILGFLMSRKAVRMHVYNDVMVYYTRNVFNCGVSLGNYILLDADKYARLDLTTIKHEYGHSLQSRMLGPLYLLAVGLPSALCNNVYARIFKKDSVWYYNRYPEKWADKLGGVKRNEN